MKTAMMTIEGIAPISFSANHTTPKFEGESHADYDARTWREKAHVDANGNVVVPGIVLSKALIATAMQMGEKVPGRGSKRWGSIFKSGILAPDPIPLVSNGAPVAKDQLLYVDVYCHADPSKGGAGGRVWRRFPIVHQWSGTATIFVVNDEITETVLKRHLDMTGRINGLGRWRPQSGGEFGRFIVRDFVWADEAKLRAA
jgi:hypothetical protein